MPTPESGADTPCVWQWATQPLPDVSANLTKALAQLTDVTVSASAYGENCLNADGSIRYFAAMETDYALSVSTEQLANALTLLLADTQQNQAGSHPGRITLTVDGATPIYVSVVVAQQASAPGLRGDDLLRALQGS